MTRVGGTRSGNESSPRTWPYAGCSPSGGASPSSLSPERIDGVGVKRGESALAVGRRTAGPAGLGRCRSSEATRPVNPCTSRRSSGDLPLPPPRPRARLVVLSYESYIFSAAFCCSICFDSEGSSATDADLVAKRGRMLVDAARGSAILAYRGRMLRVLESGCTASCARPTARRRPRCASRFAMCRSRLPP